MKSRDDFTRNLKALCATHRSVAELCRRVGINRQQFNKYLSGDSLPSAHNLRRIASFFHLPVDDLFLPAADFDARHNTALGASSAETDAMASILTRAFPGELRRLRPLLGFYHSHFLVPLSPNVMMRALVALVEENGRVYSKSIERTSVGAGLTERQRGYLSKYQGMASHLGNCIFVLEFESLTADAIAETILFPPYRKRLDILTGMSLGVSSGVHRELFSTLIAWKYLGQNIDTKEALAKCGILSKDDRSVDPTIRTFLRSKDAPAMISYNPRET
jgi:transcriptional regulator with XRE-family HTH domain